MREAGPDGLTLEQLSSSVAVSADKTRKLLEAALCFGLVQRVGGYQAWAYVAAEHCQRFRPGNVLNFANFQEDGSNTPNSLLPELLLVEDVHVSCIENGCVFSAASCAMVVQPDTMNHQLQYPNLTAVCGLISLFYFAHRCFQTACRSGRRSATCGKLCRHGRPTKQQHWRNSQHTYTCERHRNQQSCGRGEGMRRRQTRA
jgi:hypothetical protein